MSNTETRPTQKARALKAFKTGADFTANQLAARLQTSPNQARKIVSELRSEGYCIYRNRINTRFYGETLNVYRLGTPSKDMVAIAASVCGPRLFS